MDILSLTNISSPAIKSSYEKGLVNDESTDVFQSFLDSAMNTINSTNGYLSKAENEEVKLALGETENTHDLTIALQKASTALQYTVAVRDRFIEAYREIMNMQI